MIIITRNPEIIRQFSSNKDPNTTVIPLRDDEQVTSILNDSNIQDSVHVNKVSRMTSWNEHSCKRVLPSSEVTRKKSIKSLRRSAQLVCLICGDQAIGFNYDVLSCASCKTFFRRNAYQQLEKVRCLNGQGHCSVDHGVRRKCQRCRLEKCFAVGMRKDFVSIDEANETVNPSLKTSSTSEAIDASNNFAMNESFDEIDRFLMELETNTLNRIEQTIPMSYWTTIDYLSAAFSALFKHDRQVCGSINVSDHATALISWSQSANRIALDLIKYFRQIEQFELLNDDDRLILVKYNVIPLFPIVKCFSLPPGVGKFWDLNNGNIEDYKRFAKFCGEPVVIRDSFLNVVESLVQLTEKDAKFVALLAAILIFSQGLSLNENEPSTKDPLVIARAQCHYTTLLWNYLVRKLGENQACKRFVKLLSVIFEIQSTAKMSREFFGRQIHRSDTVNKIEPLMQSVLLIN